MGGVVADQSTNVTKSGVGKMRENQFGDALKWDDMGRYDMGWYDMV